MKEEFIERLSRDLANHLRMSCSSDWTSEDIARFLQMEHPRLSAGGPAMSTEKSPEQIAEERYPDQHVGRGTKRVIHGSSNYYLRQGYAACYREHVMNRPPVTMSEEVRYVWCSCGDSIEPDTDALCGNCIAAMTLPATSPVTVDGIMELWHKSHNEEAKEFNSFPHDRFRSRLESYLTPNTKP